MKGKRKSNRMLPQHRGDWRDFLKGFLGGLLVLLPIYAALMFWTLGRAERSEEQPVLRPQQNLEILPAAYNLHLMLQGEDGELAGSVLLRLDAAGGRIQLCVLPPETVLLYGKRTTGSGELFRSLGAMALQEAVRETLGIAVSGWCSYELDTLAAFWQPTLSLTLPGGHAELTASEAAQMLADASLQPQQRCELLAAAAAAALRGEQPENLQEAVLEFYAEHPPLRGSLDTAGIRVLAAAVASCCEQNAVLFDAYPDGSWTEAGSFVLADGSDRALQSRFGTG